MSVPKPPKFDVGWRVVLKDCPSPGVITDVEREVRFSCFGVNPGRKERWVYQVDWRPDFPDDHRWYLEEELELAPYER
jgi:hypothetical protein